MRKPSFPILLTLFGSLTLVLAGLMIANPLDGEPRSELLQFFGRFHPTVLHLPIAFILLLAILETRAFFKPSSSLKPAIPLILTLSIGSVLLAVLTGFLLAYAGGSNEELVIEHMRMSIFLGIGALAMGSLKLFWDQRFAKTAYRLLLLVNLGLLASSSHDGGSLTHGRDYLTKYMPNVIRPIFGLSVEAKSTANSVDDLVVFKDLIHPIIEQNCLTCHNPDKQKGKLSLETYAGHLEGGDMGPSVVPNDADNSELVFRITLPEDDEEFMPTDGKPPLTTEEVAFISWWIENGASDTATIASFETIPAAIEQYIVGVFDMMLTPEEIEAQEAKRIELYAKLNKLNDELGILITPIETDASKFRIDTFSAQKSFDRKMLKRLAPFADTIIEADFSSTQLSDASISMISQFKNLRTLNLSKTQIEGSTLANLAKVESLESLNLYGSQIKSRQIEQLAKLTQLKRLYLFQTELYSKVTIERLRAALPDCEIDLNDNAI
jgi:uncharacterized membrane protein